MASEGMKPSCEDVIGKGAETSPGQDTLVPLSHELEFSAQQHSPFGLYLYEGSSARGTRLCGASDPPVVVKGTLGLCWRSRFVQVPPDLLLVSLTVLFEFR